MSHGRLIFSFFIILCAIIVVVLVFFKSQKHPPALITNFNECAKAGYLVMESYPRQCTLPGGKFFVEQVVPEK